VRPDSVVEYSQVPWPPTFGGCFCRMAAVRGGEDKVMLLGRTQVCSGLFLSGGVGCQISSGNTYSVLVGSLATASSPLLSLLQTVFSDWGPRDVVQASSGHTHNHACRAVTRRHSDPGCCFLHVQDLEPLSEGVAEVASFSPRQS
jgi:hypothetical protein